MISFSFSSSRSGNVERKAMSAISSTAFGKSLPQGRGVNGRVLLGREGVEFAAEVFEPAVDLVSLAVLRAFEQGVFGEMGQSELVFQLVAASGVHQQGAVRDVAFDPTVNAPDAVGERIGGKFHRCLIRFSRGAPGSDPCNSPCSRPARPECLRIRCFRRGPRFGAEVHNPVGALDNVHVVFHDDDRMSPFDQRVECRAAC